MEKGRGDYSESERMLHNVAQACYVYYWYPGPRGIPNGKSHQHGPKPCIPHPSSTVCPLESHQTRALSERNMRGDELLHLIH
jgi:hypothetical protein